MAKMLASANGTTSSKRVAGISLCAIGGVMAIATFISALYHGNFKTAIETFTTVLVIGAGLLGVSLLEYLKPFNKQ